MRDTLAYLAAGILASWGLMHVIPTPQVVGSLQPATHDSRLVITQEWVVETLAMWGLAALVIITTATTAFPSTENWIYRTTATILATMAVLTASTGARTPSPWYKICLVVLSAVIALLVAASLA